MMFSVITRFFVQTEIYINPMLFLEGCRPFYFQKEYLENLYFYEIIFLVEYLINHTCFIVLRVTDFLFNAKSVKTILLEFRLKITIDFTTKCVYVVSFQRI